MFPPSVSRSITHIGALYIGDSELSCAVRPDGIRVLSQGGITTAFGPVTGGAQTRQKLKSDHCGNPPFFMIAKSLKPYIDSDLSTRVSKPIRYRDPRGGPIRVGMEATLLPRLCDVWLKARDADALTKIQIQVADRADILIRGLAHTGIIALVDEATGYQEVRHKEALQVLLEKYLLQEFKAWSKQFPNDFYKEMFRLKGWDWKGMKVNRPSVVGRYTNDIVYDRLEVGIREELEKRNPKNARGNRRSKHHQYLTDDLGVPALSQHLHTVIAFMRASSTWDKFKNSLNRALPKKGQTMELELDDG